MQNNFQTDSEKLQVTKNSQCDKARPHSLDCCPTEILHLLGKKGFCLSDFFCFPNTGWLKSPAASSSGPESGRVLWCHYRPAAGGWDACTSTCRHKHDRRVCTHEWVRVCLCELFTFLFSTFCAKVKLPSSGSVSKPPHLHHLLGLWVRPKGCDPFPPFSSESPLFPEVQEL